jgi:hypothetical protein
VTARAVSSLGAACVLAVSVLGSPAAAQQRVAVDRVAAVVGAGSFSTRVLESDVELRAYARRLRERAANALVAPLVDADRAAALEDLIGEALIAREAGRVRLPVPSRADVARERVRIVDGMGGESAVQSLLRHLGASAREIDATAERRALVGAFLRANLEGSTEVSDAELARAYARGEHPFVDRPLEDAREPLRAWLRQRAVDRVVARWIGVLETRLFLQVIAPYSPRSKR